MLMNVHLKTCFSDIFIFWRFPNRSNFGPNVKQLVFGSKSHTEFSEKELESVFLSKSFVINGLKINSSEQHGKTEAVI